MARRNTNELGWQPSCPDFNSPVNRDSLDLSFPPLAAKPASSLPLLLSPLFFLPSYSSPNRLLRRLRGERRKRGGRGGGSQPPKSGPRRKRREGGGRQKEEGSISISSSPAAKRNFLAQRRRRSDKPSPDSGPLCFVQHDTTLQWTKKGSSGVEVYEATSGCARFMRSETVKTVQRVKLNAKKSYISRSRDSRYDSDMY